jgi:hypothetical protein
MEGVKSGNFGNRSVLFDLVAKLGLSTLKAGWALFTAGR